MGVKHLTLKATWRHCLTTFSLGCILLLSGCASISSAPRPQDDAFWRDMVPAEKLEQQSTAQYSEMKNKAEKERTLASENDPQLKRLRYIANRLIPHTSYWNERARAWHWEVSLFRSSQINAFCMPAGKIAFYTGILEKLRLTDAEVAAVMGHEMAHALREHARSQAAKGGMTQLGAQVLGQTLGGGQYSRLFDIGGQLASLRYSRQDETDADLVGLDLAARSGYDPRAAVSLWEKMMAASNGSPPQWLSTHPSQSERIRRIESYLPKIMPLYHSASKPMINKQ